MYGFFESETHGYFSKMLRHSILESAGLKTIEADYSDTLTLRKYINWRKYTQTRDNEVAFLNRRRLYLSRPPLIKIEKDNNKDEHFLSALVNCHVFNDKFMTVFYCPCNSINKPWLDKFCSFPREITECKTPFDFKSAELLFEHCKKVGKYCRWHQLCFKFMEKVFFKKEDDFMCYTRPLE